MNEQLQPPRHQRGDIRASEVAREADQRDYGLLREFWGLLSHNKKWWLAPIIMALLILGLIVVLGSTALAPFIYTLF